LRRAVGAKRGRGLVLLKSAPKPENKTYNHFTPIKGQASALANKSGYCRSCYGRLVLHVKSTEAHMKDKQLRH
ncbi:MAG: hypothetical protein ABSD42_13865, partial [Candidatus Bathyarchaeia archaeon]